MQSPQHEQRLSKTLSWLLRHGAVKEHLPMGPDGFVPVASILQHHRFRHQFTVPIIQQIVANDAKRRYTLREIGARSGTYEICANQGHSLNCVQAEEAWQKIASPEEVPTAVHGTYMAKWPAIKSQGLRKQRRTHVHFATSDRPAENISGFRGDYELLIYLDVPKAMRAGMTLYRSLNDVILCDGFGGCIPPEYFARVVERKTRKVLN